MKVKDIMTKKIISVDKDVDLEHVLQLMKKHEITKIPVLENKKLVGIVTDNNIALKLGSKRKREVTASRLHASSVTEKDFETVSRETDIIVILRKVGEPGPTMLPVLEKDELVGIITKADLLPLVKSNKSVNTVMQTNIYSVSPDDRVVHARRIMLDNNIQRIPVVDQGELRGMISDREIAFAFASLKKSFSLGKQKHQLEELLVRDIMKIPAIWITSGMSVANAAKVMLKVDVGALPILRNEEIIGIVTRTDLIKTLVT